MTDEAQALGSAVPGAAAPDVGPDASAPSEVSPDASAPSEVSPDASTPGEAPAAAPPPPPAFAPAFPPAAPVAWAPVDPAVAPAPQNDDRPWGLVDPGPISDGRWMSRGYASSSRRAAALRLALAVQVAFDIGLIVLQRGLAFAGDSGVRLSTGQISIVRGVLGVVGPVSIAISIALIVAIFAWISRVVENVPPLTGRTPQHSPRESIGWWFVPVASWAMPFLIVRDAAWRLRTTSDDAAVRLILPWWLLHVGAAIGGLVVGRLVHLDSATSVLLAQAVLVVEALSDVLMIAVVSSVARSERVQAARLDFSGRPGQVWPRFAPRPPIAAVADADWTPSAAHHGLPLAGRRVAFRPDDPLAPAPDERSDDYEDRLLAALEAEATQR